MIYKMFVKRRALFILVAHFCLYLFDVLGARQVQAREHELIYEDMI